MSDFSFIKGGDVVIRLNGEVLGGVKRAYCTVKNTATDIKEYLTDKPFASIVKSRYTVVLEMNCDNAEFFDDKYAFDSIEFDDSNKCVRYSDCRITQIKAEATPNKSVEYKVEITAEKRNVCDV